MVILYDIITPRDVDRLGGSQRPVGGPVAATVAAAAALAWAARGRSSSVFGRSVWRGPAHRRAFAVTFDDGPGQGTSAVLDILARYRVPATFVMCGEHVRRRPSVARDVVSAGHQVGNHTDTHPRLWLQRSTFIGDELRRAQRSIEDATGTSPVLFRSTYGVRWFGLRQAQRELGLLHVMWTTIARDWVLDDDAITARLISGARNGAIYCLHDGRGRDTEADISNTVAALRNFLPQMLDKGYQFLTVGELIGYSGSLCPKTSSGA